MCPAVWKLTETLIDAWLLIESPDRALRKKNAGLGRTAGDARGRGNRELSPARGPYRVRRTSRLIGYIRGLCRNSLQLLTRSCVVSRKAFCRDSNQPEESCGPDRRHGGGRVFAHRRACLRSRCSRRKRLWPTFCETSHFARLRERRDLYCPAVLAAVLIR
jgi:hypothetical protein